MYDPIFSNIFQFILIRILLALYQHVSDKLLTFIYFFIARHILETDTKYILEFTHHFNQIWIYNFYANQNLIFKSIFSLNSIKILVWILILVYWTLPKCVIFILPKDLFFPHLYIFKVNMSTITHPLIEHCYIKIHVNKLTL